MMYWASLFLSLLAAPACLALPSQEKRASDASGASLYAYGTNISGFPVVFAHENAGLYVAESNSTVEGLFSITWDIPTLTTATSATTNGTVLNGTTVGGMYVDTSDDLFDEVLVNGNATAGFAVYGKQLVYYDGSSIQSEFWAKDLVQSDGSVVWVLHWNSNNEYRSGAVPVVLKTTSPSMS